MRLVKDNSPGGWAVKVPCIGPHHYKHDAQREYPRKSVMFTLAEGYADLDGEAFRAYFCSIPCANDWDERERRWRNAEAAFGWLGALGHGPVDKED